MLTFQTVLPFVVIDKNKLLIKKIQELTKKDFYIVNVVGGASSGKTQIMANMLLAEGGHNLTSEIFASLQNRDFYNYLSIEDKSDDSIFPMRVARYSVIYIDDVDKLLSQDSGELKLAAVVKICSDLGMCIVCFSRCEIKPKSIELQNLMCSVLFEYIIP